MFKRRLTVSLSSNVIREVKKQKLQDEISEEKRGKSLPALESYFTKLIAYYNLQPEKLRKEDLWKHSQWKDAVEMFSQYAEKLKMNSEEIDFLFVGNSLQAATECYVIKVNSLSADTFKLFSMLQRGTPNTKEERDGADDDVAGLTTTTLAIQRIKSSNKTIPHRFKKKKTTTKIVCPAAITSKLDTIPAVNPIFQKLSSEVGDFCRPHLMIRNILPPNQLNLLENKKLFEPSPPPAIRKVNSTSYIKIPICAFANFDSCKVRSEIEIPNVLLTEKAAEEENLCNKVPFSDSCFHEELTTNFGKLSQGSHVNSHKRNEDDDGNGKFNETANVEVFHYEIGNVEQVNLQQNDERRQSPYVDINECKFIKKNRYQRIKPKIPLTLDEIMNIDEDKFNLKLEVIENQKNFRKFIKSKKDLKLNIGTVPSNILETFVYSSCEFQLNQQEFSEVTSNSDESIDQQVEIQSIPLKNFSTSSPKYIGNISSVVEEESGFVEMTMKPFQDFLDSSFGEISFKQTKTSTPLQKNFNHPRESLSTIKNLAIKEINRSIGKPVKFSDVHNNTNETLNGFSSFALTFLSVLQAANEERIEIIKSDSVDDFYVHIKKPKNSAQKRLFDESCDDFNIDENDNIKKLRK